VGGEEEKQMFLATGRSKIGAQRGSWVGSWGFKRTPEDP